MMAMKRGWMLVSVLLALLSGCAECAVAQAPLAVTTVQDTVYTASGAAASGTVLVSWSGFTTASGAVVPAGTMSATIGTGGLLSIALAPNAGATPIGSYYTATFHLSDGSTSREFWVVPVTVGGAPPVKLAAIQTDVLPTSVAMQTVSKTYVDMAIAAAVAGHPTDSSTPYVLKDGDTMAGPLVLAADPVSANQAADKHYVDENVIVFGASGSGHAQGVVPDPGSTAGTTRYLREDGTWYVPPAGGSGTMASQNANAVAITGGTVDGTVIGGATPAAASVTTLNGVAPSNFATITGNFTTPTTTSLTSPSCIYGGSYSSASATLTYNIVGKMVWYSFNFYITTVGSCTGYPQITVPWTFNGTPIVTCREYASSGIFGGGQGAGGGSTVLISPYDNNASHWNFNGAAIGCSGFGFTT